MKLYPIPLLGRTLETPSSISLTTLLENFIPGYGPIHKFLLYKFGFDITVLVSFGAVVWLTFRLAQSFWSTARQFVLTNWTCEISVSSNDETFNYVRSFWVHKVQESRRLQAETTTKSAWELDNATIETWDTTCLEGNLKWLDFSNQEAQLEPEFTPAFGYHTFKHRGISFTLQRRECTVFDNFGSGEAPTLADKEVMTISCFGRSAEPIKELLKDAKEMAYCGYDKKTVIRRPAAKDLRRYGGRNCWIKLTERPRRPIDTVILPEKQTENLLNDINEYLHPVTARWYADRGIPYRRGYLLYGPPGTGKSSLSFALAGVFGLDIYIVSLLEPSLTDEDLGVLFNNLPARCIVLLEDIDTAGLTRDPWGPEKEKVTKLSEEDATTKISLAGLLNTIDGVASHEGRVLVMTTNRRKKLDKALVRPGRIDIEVEFKNATQEQATALFKRMYTKDIQQMRPQASTGPLGHEMPVKVTRATSMAMDGAIDATANCKHGVALVGAEGELEKLAEEFSKPIKDLAFSPAELQGFLLKHKDNPQKASKEIAEWVQNRAGAKKSEHNTAPDEVDIDGPQRT